MIHTSYRTLTQFALRVKMLAIFLCLSACAQPESTQNSEVSSTSSAPGDYPAHILSSETSGSYTWSLYQNAGSRPLQWIGPNKKVCDNFQGNEPLPRGRKSYANFCRSYDGAVIAVPNGSSTLYGWALYPRTTVESRRGYYETERKESCGRDCTRTVITIHVQDVNGQIVLQNSMQWYRTNEPVWLYIERPFPDAGAASAGEWNYQVQINNGATGKLHWIKQLDDALFGGPRGTLENRVNCCFLVNLHELIKANADGVQLGQPFKITLSTLGTFDNGLDDERKPAKKFGSSLTLALLQEDHS